MSSVLFAVILGIVKASLLKKPAELPCSLTKSGPVVVKADGEIVENLDITTSSKDPGIYVAGFKNVVIRNVKIRHHEQTEWPYGNGIYVAKGSDNVVIDGVDVELISSSSGAVPLQEWHNFNIFCYMSPNASISNVRVRGGSTGVMLQNCDDSVVSNMVAENFRGPFPRGQCMQSGLSDNVVLEDFYCGNEEASSWTEDSISIWRSSNNTIRRGIVNGSNSPTGVGVMMEQDLASKSDGLVEDVDAINMGDGCFSAYGARNIRFVRTRCRKNHCEGWSGRGPPTSNALLFAAGDENGLISDNIQLEQGQYFDVCNPNNLVWSKTPGAWTKTDLTQVDFALRERVRVDLCFDRTDVVV